MGANTQYHSTTSGSGRRQIVISTSVMKWVVRNMSANTAMPAHISLSGLKNRLSIPLWLFKTPRREICSQKMIDNGLLCCLAS